MKPEEKIKTRSEIVEEVRRIRESTSDRIITTNGCYDLIHEGHLYVLRNAKSLGGILIVGLNSDSSIKGYKSPYRPIKNQNTRANILAEFQCVDYVTIFDELDSLEFLKSIKPNIHVKGGNVIEDRVRSEEELLKSWGGELVRFPEIGEGLCSTTNLAEKAFLSIYAKEKETYE